MTVVVGILNRRGASIAADSATTNFVGRQSSNGEIDYQDIKIRNSGNKMITIKFAFF